MAAETAARTAAAAPAVALSENAGAPSALRAVLADAIAECAPEIISLSRGRIPRASCGGRGG